MKKIFYLILLIPVLSFGQSNRTVLNAEADSLLTNSAHNNNAKYFNRMFKKLIISDFNVTAGDILPKANGGTGTTTPALVAGTNISITGIWPNQTINQSGGSGISNSAPANRLMMSDGVNAVNSGISNSSGTLSGLGFSGNIYFGGNNGTSAARRVEIEENTTSPSTVLPTLRLTAHNNSGTPSVGFGVSEEFATRNTAGATVIGSTIESVSTNVGAGTEAFDVHIKSMSAGSAASDKLVLTSTGSLSFTNFTVINGWSATSTHKFRVTPQGNLEISMRLNGTSATSSTFASLTGLSLPVSSGTLIFMASTGGSTAVMVTATITSSSTISLDYASFPTSSVTITGSVPIDSAF